MLKVGRAYNTKSGERFLILAKKNRASSNGCSFIGENVKTGLVTFFNHKGEHCMKVDWNLQVDFYKWIGIVSTRLTSSHFVPKEKLDDTIVYTGFLCIQNDLEYTIEYRSVEGFHSTYA